MATNDAHHMEIAYDRSEFPSTAKIGLVLLSRVVDIDIALLLIKG